MEDILATCLHLYGVDIKDGKCYMLNLPQSQLPTPTVFNSTTPTFPEWARELRACLNISQFEHIELLDFAYDVEEPLTTDVMVQQDIDNIQRLYGLHKHIKTSEMNKHYLEVMLDVVRTQSSLRTYNKHNETLMHNKHFRMQQLQQYIEQVNFWVTSSCTLKAQKRTKRPTSSSSENQHRWEMFRQLRHQYAAGARVQQYTLLQSIIHPQPRWTETSQQQQFQKWIQDSSLGDAATARTSKTLIFKLIF